MTSSLLSTDRFAAAQAHPTLSAQTRGALVERFGLFGLRLATTLIRQGHREPAGLVAELVRRSGLDELRTVLATQFTERRDLLKARSALLLLDRALREEPRPEAQQLAGEVERILAGADPAAQREAVITALARWQRRAESPLSDRATSERARVVVRSCEGMLARLGQDQPGS